MTIAVHETESRPMARRKDDESVGYVEAVVASAFAISAEAIRDSGRGSAVAAFARQVAMYLTHTRLGLGFTAAGAAFGRDRTTAAYACRRVEEKREDPSIDEIVDYLERALDIWSDRTGQ